MLKLAGVTKQFGRVAAVRDLSFDIGDRGIVGLLGTNGAGKTTTLRLVAGSLLPSAGDIWVRGFSVRRQALDARRLIGFLPEVPPLYDSMPVVDFLEFAGRLRGLSRSDAAKRARAVAEECAIGDLLSSVIGTISRGQRQRVGIAQAIVHDPALLVLDEPTVGLDPVQLAGMRSLIHCLGEDRAVLLSTHNLSEASALCGTVLVMKAGMLVAREEAGTAWSNDRTLRLVLRDPPADATPRLVAIPGVKAVRGDRQGFVVMVEANADPGPAIVRLVAEAGWTLVSFEESSLERLILSSADGEPDK